MITYQKPDRIFLFGGGKTMWEFRAWLKERGYSTISYTAPRQVTAETPREAAIVEDLAGLAWPHVSEKALAICFGPAWQIGPQLRLLFGNRLIDFMSIPYPAYLGGAHETWAELLGEKKWGCCLQLVTENTKQGECHDGGVIAGDEFRYAARYAHYLDFLKGFIASIENGHEFDAIQPTDGRSFFPRLNTEKNGWIDWSWSAAEIFRFINAFSPYGGASTYALDTVIRLKDAQVWQQGMMHPYCAGLVMDVTPTLTRIACRDGAIGVPGIGCLDPGDRLHTPRAKLEEALLYQPTYDAKGDTAGILPKGESIRFDLSAPTYDKAIHIRLLKPDDVTQVYVDWLNDPKVNQFLEVRHQHWTRSMVEDYVRGCINRDEALFGIYLGDRHIGNVKIGPIYDYHQHADISYFIGDTSMWGKGYATKAVNLAVHYAFNTLGLHRLQAGIYDSNTASEAVLRKCGFVQDAVFKQQLLMDGEWQDHVYFSKINPDWKA